jgi:hypothetical protein
MKLPIVFALACLAGVASAQEIKLEYDHDVDFSQYKTFAWSPAQQPSHNPANHLRILKAVDQALAAKGLTKEVAGEPDAIVMYHGHIGETVKVKGTNAGSYQESTNLRTMIDITRVKEGTLVVELYDFHSKEIVWRGMASGIAVKPDAAEEVITAAVNKMIQGYPPDKPASPKP